ncbi:hypothetical protein [Halobacillus sp. A5]|uniref:hypothetical protein n=1 Tax=Halobacillus sp. A5 TaxID=2880263 RepID=UPI0020A6B5E5|nr:hypothetical protein [Halobacillus sp. A5]MCP3025434.1 hypothetical protein [Halobacillus sp. A5]
MEERNEEAAVEPIWDTNSNPSNISKILFWVGGLEIALGFFVALYMADMTYEVGWTTFLIWFLPTLISGLLVIGFAEVIKLLTIMTNKMDS